MELYYKIVFVLYKMVMWKDIIGLEVGVIFFKQFFGVKVIDEEFMKFNEFDGWEEYIV